MLRCELREFVMLGGGAVGRDQDDEGRPGFEVVRDNARPTDLGKVTFE